jgi:DNA gyrase subunit A
MSVADVRVMGRATQGVRLINLAKKNDTIASVCKVLHSTEEEEDIEQAEVVDQEAPLAEGAVNETETTDNEQ